MTDRFLITIMLPDDVSQRISATQEQFRVPSWPKNIEPHITLFPPFTHRSTIPEIKQLLEAVAHQINPFQLRVSGVGSFKPKTSVLFANVDRSASLFALQKLITQSLKPIANRPPSSPNVFQPHITLSNRLKPETFYRQREEMKSLVINETFLCDQFSLLQLDKGKWKAIHTFTLSD